MYREFLLPTASPLPGALPVHDGSSFARSPALRALLVKQPFNGSVTMLRCDRWAPERRPGAIACIPARNEATLLPNCLVALGDALSAEPDAGAVIVVNNTSDGSADIVRTWAESVGVPVLCCEVEIAPPADTVAIARRLAMDLALVIGSDDAVLLSTDADTVVPPDWVERMMARVRLGAELVVAGITVDPAEAAALPPGVRLTGEIEARLAEVYETIWSRLAVDGPCPLLVAAGGANLAVSAGAYRAVGGLPVDHRNEDRALAAAILAAGFPFAVDRTISVTTSLRTEARARHGMAEAIAARCHEADPPVDDLVVPLPTFLARVVACLNDGEAPERGAQTPLRLQEATAELVAAEAFLRLLETTPAGDRLAVALAMSATPEMADV